MTEESLGQLENEVSEALEELHHVRSIPNPARRARREASVRILLQDLQDRARFAEVEQEIDRYISDWQPRR